MTATSLLVATLCVSSYAASPAEALRAEGLELGYNLDYAAAIEAFDRAIAVDPCDATAHRLAAAVAWMRILFSQGAITVEDYLGRAKPTASGRRPPSDLAALFDRHLDQAITLAEERVRRFPNDADARFQLGAAAALRTTYIATVHGRVLDGVGLGRRAYKEHTRVMGLDASRKDAALIVGMYRYVVANLSMPMRVMARLAGFEGDRTAGLRLVEDAAAYPSAARTNAKLTLVLMYNREGRHDAALTIIRDLQAEYPRNRLLWLEAATTLLRAGRGAEALQAVDDGFARFARDPRPKAFGEEAQWRFQRAAALIAIGNKQDASEDLQAVAVADAPEGLRQRARALLDGSAKGAGR